MSVRSRRSRGCCPPCRSTPVARFVRARRPVRNRRAVAEYRAARNPGSRTAAVVAGDTRNPAAHTAAEDKAAEDKAAEDKAAGCSRFDRLAWCYATRFAYASKHVSTSLRARSNTHAAATTARSRSLALRAQRVTWARASLSRHPAIDTARCTAAGFDLDTAADIDPAPPPDIDLDTAPRPEPALAPDRAATAPPDRPIGSNPRCRDRIHRLPPPGAQRCPASNRAQRRVSNKVRLEAEANRSARSASVKKAEDKRAARASASWTARTLRSADRSACRMCPRSYRRRSCLRTDWCRAAASNRSAAW